MTTASVSATDPFDHGPYNRLFAALRLGPMGAQALAFDKLVRRAIVLAAIAWVPLVILGAIQGLAIGPTARESVLYDIAAYGRYVVALPLFIVAEGVCIPQLSAIAHQFADGGFIPDSHRNRFDALIASTRRLLDERWIEVLLATLAYLVAILSAETTYPTKVSSWVSQAGPWGRTLTLAGWWRLFVSQPLFLIVLIGWLWRIILWTRFLWEVSQMNLRLVQSHPDHVGGLQFVSLALRGFRWFAFALAVVTAATVSEAFFMDDRPIRSFQATVITLVVVVLLLTAGPLLVFYRPLLRARIKGTLLYGKLAADVGRQFQRRWLGQGTAIDADVLAQPDFSATTDLYSVTANVYTMSLIPFPLRALLPLIITTLVPFFPVVLAILPLKELLSVVAKLLL